MGKLKCFYCVSDATYFDIVQKGSKYIVADVCNNHLVMGLSS